MAERLVAATNVVILLVEQNESGVTLKEIWIDDHVSCQFETSVSNARVYAERCWGKELQWLSVPNDVADPVRFARETFGTVAIA